jgi:hypothetical protein
MAPKNQTEQEPEQKVFLAIKFDLTSAKVFLWSPQKNSISSPSFTNFFGSSKAIPTLAISKKTAFESGTNGQMIMVI